MPHLIAAKMRKKQKKGFPIFNHLPFQKQLAGI